MCTEAHTSFSPHTVFLKNLIKNSFLKPSLLRYNLYSVMFIFVGVQFYKF